MKKMRGLLAVLVLLVLLPGVAAVTSISVDPLQDHIIYGERARFNVTLTNQESVVQTYEIFSPLSGLSWSVQTRPLRNRMVTLNPNLSFSTEVVVEPIERFPPGVHVVNLDVTSSAGESYRKPLQVYLGSATPQEYLPSVRVSVDLQERVDPREPQSIRLFLENLNPLDLTGMVARVVSSDLPELNLEQTVDLPPAGRKAVEFTVKLPDLQQPKEYPLFIQLERGAEIIKVVPRKIEVIALELPFASVVDRAGAFLQVQQSMRVTNPGNVRTAQKVTLPVGTLEQFFISAQPEARVVKQEGQRLLEWDVELAPGAEARIDVATSYRVPFVLMIIMLAGLVLYAIFRNPLALSKAASNVELKEGGVSSMKVTIAVKNLRKGALRSLEVLDRLPGIADITKDIEMGTLKPSQILRGKHGIYIMWKLSELDGKEERIIHYNIKSRLNIIGTMQLPRAKATFVTHRGKKKVSYSNVYRVTTE